MELNDLYLAALEWRAHRDDLLAIEAETGSFPADQMHYSDDDAVELVGQFIDIMEGTT